MYKSTTWKLSLTVGAFILALCLVPRIVFAQSAVSEDTLQLYRDQISAYRDSERTFEVAKEQYFKLQTLASLEQAVSGTRNALLARTKVLTTYLTILRTELYAQHGINLTLKDDALERLDTQLAYLKTHEDAVLIANDRAAIATVVTDFSLKQLFIEDAVYRSRLLIEVGKVQTVNDKARTLLADIKKAHEAEKATSLVTAKRERAYTETSTHIEATEAALLELLSQKYTVEKEFLKGQYTQQSKSINEPYVSAQKAIGFLEELLSL
ncbi:MAG: hypothetical protein H6773_01760 [Pseudomonadales bacterium]|nr:hypothetical protein [Candidatus Woesebacteria bacterium]MCB9800883.1 hypothetical protein [Pseudomonadales bacterium]